jgi:hypothetical protein
MLDRPSMQTSAARSRSFVDGPVRIDLGFAALAADIRAAGLRVGDALSLLLARAVVAQLLVEPVVP